MIIVLQSFNLKETIYDKICIDKKPLPKNAELYSLFSHNNHEKSEQIHFNFLRATVVATLRLKITLTSVQE